MDKFVKRISYKAGEIALKYFNHVMVVRAKASKHDVVTEADLAVEKMIIHEIKKNFPDHGIISEEMGEYQLKDSDYVWYIDPIDGTLNFSRNVPIFCAMIGLAYKQKVILGSIYHPTQDRLYFAKKSHGAYLNDKRIHCSKKRTWEHSYGTSGAIYSSPERVSLFEKLVQRAKKEHFVMSGLGSSGVSISYVADGSYDWMMSGIGSTSGVWDYAAGSVLLREAGCKVGNRAGEPWSLKDKSCISANPYIYQQLVKITKQCR